MADEMHTSKHTCTCMRVHTHTHTHNYHESLTSIGPLLKKNSSPNNCSVDGTRQPCKTYFQHQMMTTDDNA
jgi:hypothetical protein